MHVGSGSRLPALSDAIESVNRSGEERILREIVERAADPRDFIAEPDRGAKVVAYLNQFLRYDDLELQSQGGRMRLVKAGTSFVVVDSLSAVAATIDFDTVRHDLDRALANVEADPEDAVTAASSVVESVCRSILIELGLGLPEKRDIQSLYKAVRDPLGLYPDKEGVPDEIAADVRSILGGLNSMIQGIGALRTHGGDAHGRERGFKRSIDPRIARLAIHSAGAAALFMIETWQLRHPTKALNKH
ncbi:abortive infection family protein [Aurantimonas sp. A2-1-M11]